MGTAARQSWQGSAGGEQRVSRRDRVRRPSGLTAQAPAVNPRGGQTRYPCLTLECDRPLASAAQHRQMFGLDVSVCFTYLDEFGDTSPRGRRLALLPHVRRDQCDSHVHADGHDEHIIEVSLSWTNTGTTEP